MAYNLLDDAWMPVRRDSGKVERIAPWQIAETADPAVRIESPRPDFDAALLEFLIGLVQTVFTPKDSTEWEDVYEAGVSPEDLRARMQQVRDAFFLDGDGPRFMQDLTVHHDEKVEERPIVELLIDQGAAGAADLFAKDGGFQELGYPAAAAALLTLQAFAPSGGAGHRTSLRGGGPLSVTIQDATLWRTVWCNVLVRADLERLPGNCARNGPADCMPWMGETRRSEKGKQSTLPEDVHPLQHFWGLPRRFRLVVESAARGTCAIDGDSGVPVVRSFHSRPHGTDYEGPYLHPLTPYTRDKAGTKPPNPKKGGRAGLPYRDWPLLTVGSETSLPPKVVDAFLRQERWRFAKTHRLMARGYAMDNMKPLRFVEGEAPLLRVPAAALADVRAHAAALVAASESVRRTLLQQVKAAWSDRPGDQPGEVEARVDVAFWSATESAFLAALREIAAGNANGETEARAREKRRFLQALRQGARAIFDAHCPMEVEDGPASLARVVRARRNLDRFTDPDSKQMMSLVGLAPSEPDDRRPKRRSKKKEPAP